jgi:FSR family fosmidomycin resistance protein-like MFS transporter
MHTSVVRLRADVLAYYGVSHFLIDFACAYAMVSLPFRQSIDNGYYFKLIILYNLIAFGSQPLWGLLSDRFGNYQFSAAAGLILASCGAGVMTFSLLYGTLMLACGNALFHVGGGAAVYVASKGRASWSGIFVAPGGAGLAAGIMLGFIGTVHTLWLIPVLLTAAFLLMFTSFKQPEGAKPDHQPYKLRFGWMLSVLFLFLLVVTVRSVVGFGLPAPWKEAEYAVYFLTFAVFAGKSLGGVLADRYGWRRVCSIMLLLSVFFSIGYRDSLYLTCAALFCMQATTGVTLAGTQSLFPARPAFAFGLPCIAIVIGAAPFLADFPVGSLHTYVITALCLSGFLAAYFALSFYNSAEA